MWKPDSRGVQPGGDDEGGDIQAGEACTVRYIRPDLPGSLITRAAYPAEDPTRPGEFFVGTMVELIVCENPADPGGTEIWSDTAWGRGGEGPWGSAAEAEAAARKLAEAWLAGEVAPTWDGQPG